MPRTSDNNEIEETPDRRCDRPVLRIDLGAEEWRALRAIVEGHCWEKNPEALLEAFVHDLTGFEGNGGSDEREYSRSWMRRRYGPREIVVEMRKQQGHRIGEEVW